MLSAGICCSVLEHPPCACRAVTLQRWHCVRNGGMVEPLAVQVHGAGGTGKTTLLGVMRQHLPPGFFTVSAFTGVAATLVGFGARTLNSLLRFGVPTGGGRGTAHLFKPPSGEQKKALKRVFSTAKLLVVDEMSMLSPAMLVAMDLRLKAALDARRPFGGVGILLCGDHLQIPPTGGGSLPEAVTTSTPSTTQANARALYVGFETYHLRTQHRFDADPDYGADMAALRTMVARPVSSDLLDKLQPLTPATFQEDPTFADPTKTRILVTNNYQRSRVNFQRAKDFATATGRVVLAWRRPFTAKVMKALRSRSALAAALSSMFDETVSYFVAGAPCMVLDNFGTVRGVANGTTGTYHSISLDDATRDDLRDQLEGNPAPGSVVWLQSPPLTLNVHLLPDPEGGGLPRSGPHVCLYHLEGPGAYPPSGHHRADQGLIVHPSPPVHRPKSSTAACPCACVVDGLGPPT